jgi:hypothetical protein
VPIVVSSSALADNAIYVELDPVTDEDSLAAVYRDVETREKAAQKVIEIARDVYADGIDLALRCAARAGEIFIAF